MDFLNKTKASLLNAGSTLSHKANSVSETVAREFDTLKSKKVPQSLEIGLFFCQIFIFII